MEDRAHRFECLLRAADDRLILGHRLSEWCGHAPILEEELALANVALDLLGQAQRLYERASKFDEGGRNPDALVFLRDADAYRNAVLVEQPNGDFAATIVRQYLFDVYNRLFLSALSESDDAELVEFAGGALKEATFHERHSRSWLMRLGDGTEESHRRMQTAVDGLWRFTGELFAVDPISEAAARAGWWPDLRKLTEPWRVEVERTCREATLELPEAGNSVAVDGRSGRHTEHLALLLAEMQVLARAEPDAQW